MGKLIRVDGMRKAGGTYTLLLNESDIKKVDKNQKAEGEWKSVVETMDGKAHFVTQTMEDIIDQLGG